MNKRNVVLTALLFVLVMAVLVVPVSGGLTITDGATITTRTGNTSAVINITGSEIPINGNITIDISALNGDVASGIFTNANVVVDDTAAAATWSGDVAGNTLTLTSNGGPTAVGENITVTFTGAGGNPWLSDTSGGVIEGSLTATRTDTSETATFNFAISTTLGPGGLTVTPGEKITASDGATSMVITITDAPMLQYDTIIMDVSGLDPLVSNGTLTLANVVIDDTAGGATWTGVLDSGSLTLTSNGGPTEVGENVTVTFTGAGGNPWIPNTVGERTVTLSAYRMDNYGTADFSFVIETTPPPGGLTVADGVKITTMNGSTSPVITVEDSTLTQGSTITIDVSGLNPLVASGSLDDANVLINDTAVAATWTGAVTGNILTLTSNGGPTAVGENITVTLTGSGGNPWISNTGGEWILPLTATRNDGLGWSAFSFVIETAPPPGFTVAANFSASPTSDIAPLTVAFTDTSQGSPTSWNWDFGDGSTSTLQNPDHTYSNAGIYTVILNATNAYGSDTKTQWNYINVHRGAVRESDTSIAGLTITNCAGPQLVTVDTSVLTAALIPNNSVLVIQPPHESGFKSITLYALDGTGFTIHGNLISGNPTGVHLVSENIAPSSGFSNEIGTISSFNYTIDLPAYPCNAILSTKIWEGEIPEYETKLLLITSNNSVVPIGTAFTAKITKTNFPFNKSVKIHMSVNSSWNPSLSGGPGDVYIWRIADNGNSGQILPTNNLYPDPVNNLNYYEADSPLGLSTFGLSSFTGSNNPFQLIIFTLETVVNPNNPSNGQGSSQGGGGSAGPSTTQTSGATPAPQDPGKTAKIYANANGVITQAMSLQSTDGLATVNIGTGIVAKDAGGKPLSSISIKAIPAENLPGSLSGFSYSFAGRAYELQPDGATFSPGISISFTAPNAQFGQELLVKMYDNATGIWQDVPTKTNPQTGTISADISHFCCLALFAKSVTTEPAITNTPVPPIVPKAATLPPSAMTTFVGMILTIADLIAKNVIIFAGIIIVVIASFLYGRKRRRDRLMKLT